MTRPSALKLVPLVLVILIAALPAAAGAETIDRSFGNWTATFSGTFDYEWSEPDPEPCYLNGDGSVRARFSGRLGEFEISYLRNGAFSAFGPACLVQTARTATERSQDKRRGRPLRLNR